MLTRIINKLSRSISFILIGSLALSTVGTTYPQDRFKKAFGAAKGAVFGGASKLASTATSHIKGGLSSAFNNVKQMDRTVVVDRLQKQVENLGQKVGYMANCMAKGTCSQAERAAFIGTSVTVLALTVAVVGVTLSVAATSKEVESVTKTTSQEVKGWGPQQIFQRLTNTTNNFKRSLSELKQGMLKKELTRGQKKFLYGTAISIAALVTIAVGVGVASYIYAEKKESERQAEVPQDSIIPLEQLAQLKTIGGVEAAQGTFGKLFDQVIQVKEFGSNLLQESTLQMKNKLEEARRLAQQALQATGQEKNLLLQQAEAAYKQALSQTNAIIARVKSEGPSLIKQALYDLFGIRYDNVKQSIAQFNQELGQLNPKLAALSAVPTWKNITSVQNNWAAVQTKGYALWNNLGALLQQLAGRKKAREGWWGYLGYGTPQEESREKRAELMRDYPLAYKLDFLLEIYPKFLQSVAQTDLISAGNAAEQLLYHTGKTLQNLASLPSSSGVWGQLLISPEMVNSLKNIGNHILQLGVHLKDFTHGEPLKELTHQLPSRLEETPIREWFNAVMWQPAASVQQIKKITNTLTPQMLEANEQLRNALTKATQLSNTFTQHSSNLLLLVKQNMVETLSQKPFQNYSNVAKQAVVKEAKISKELLNDLLLYVAGIVNYLEKLISPLIETVETINSILGKELISQSNLDKLKQSAAQFVSIRDELARLRQVAKENLPQ